MNKKEIFVLMTKKTLRKLVIILFYCCLWFIPFAQQVNLGRLPVKNYSKKNYQAGTQSWDMAQDEHGVMYFANNDGLLRFDGTYWHTYPITNGTIVRSVELSANGRIYVGGQGEIGYFLLNNSGHLIYHSLIDQLPEAYNNMADVWGIELLDGNVFFQSSKYLLRLDKDDRLSVIDANGLFEFMGQINGKLYLQKDRALFILNGNKLSEEPVFKTSFLITSFLRYSENRTLVTSLKQGIFIYDGQQSMEPWSTSEDTFFKEKRIYTTTLLADQQIAIGTSLGGLMILDTAGNAIRHITKISGLQNANILSLFKDAADNLWCALDNGIDYVEVQSAFSQVLPDFPLEGTGYNIAINKGHLYFATSNGLYVNEWKSRYTPKEQDAFQLVNQTAGQAWQLHKLGDDLLLGHHDGAFLIDDNKASSIIKESTWGFVQRNETTSIRGHYSGISLLEKKNGLWGQTLDFKGIDESCRIMVGDSKGQIWMTHPYRGVFRLLPTSKKDSVAAILYSDQNGLPSALNNYVFSINGISFVCDTSGGVYF